MDENFPKCAGCIRASHNAHCAWAVTGKCIDGNKKSVKPMQQIQKQEQEILDFLKANGYVVDYAHAMPGQLNHKLPYTNLEKGLNCGFTVGYVYNINEIMKWKAEERKADKPKAVIECVAYCSANDQFDKKKGRIIVLARIMKKLELTKKFKARC